jgi:tetratricopeptide (TPR) repeat protein
VAHPFWQSLRFWAGAGLCSLTLIAFGGAGGNDFFNLDDYEYVVYNPHVRTGVSWRNTAWALTTFHAGNWQPLTWLSLQLDAEWHGTWPAGYHWTNVFLHTANALLLYLALARMTGAVGRSAAATALFAVHPLRVESVAWLAERKDVLSALFALSTIYAYAWYAERPGWRRYGAVALPMALGLAAKPMLVTLPLVLLLLDYWPLARWQPVHGLRVLGRLVGEKTPLLFLSVGAAVLTVRAQEQGRLLTSLEQVSMTDRLANAVDAYVRYLGMTLWPQGLAVYYPHPGPLPWWQVLAAGLILVLITGLVVWAPRSRPYLPVGWFWYLGMLVPVIGLVQVGTQAVADRYTYLPSVGLSLMAVWGLVDLVSRWGFRPAVLAAPAAVAVVLLGVTTWVQVGYWEDSASLWQRTLAVTADNYVAHNNLAMVHLERGRRAEALRHFLESLRIRPSVGGYKGAGMVLLRQERYEEAIGMFRQAVRLDPGDASAHENLGQAFLLKDDIPAAEHCFREAQAIEPDNAEVHLWLGEALLRQDRRAEAQREFDEAGRLWPHVVEGARERLRQHDAARRSGGAQGR